MWVLEKLKQWNVKLHHAMFLLAMVLLVPLGIAAYIDDTLFTLVMIVYIIVVFAWLIAFGLTLGKQGRPEGFGDWILLVLLLASELYQGFDAFLFCVVVLLLLFIAGNKYQPEWVVCGNT